MIRKRGTSKIPEGMNIPVGKDGYVPDWFYEDIQSKRKERYRKMDNSRAAKVIYPRKMTRSQAVAWAKNPGKSDVSGIDTMAPSNVEWIVKQDPEFMPEDHSAQDYERARHMAEELADNLRRKYAFVSKSDEREEYERELDRRTWTPDWIAKYSVSANRRKGRWFRRRGN